MPFGLGTECPPDWAVVNGTVDHDAACPFGTKLIGDVTLPLNAAGLDYLAVLYGEVVYLIPGALSIFVLLWKRGSRELFFCLFGFFLVVVNELGLKRIWTQSRPMGSCNTSCGMPSGHSCISIGYLTWMLLEAWGPSLFCFFRLRNQQHALRDRLLWSAAWACFLAPIPWSRVHLLDHSLVQVGAGSGFGVGFALIWYLLLQRFVGPRWLRGHSECCCGAPRSDSTSSCADKCALSSNYRCYWVKVERDVESNCDNGGTLPYEGDVEAGGGGAPAADEPLLSGYRT